MNNYGLSLTQKPDSLPPTMITGCFYDWVVFCDSLPFAPIFCGTHPQILCPWYIPTNCRNYNSSSTGQEIPGKGIGGGPSGNLRHNEHMVGYWVTPKRSSNIIIVIDFLVFCKDHHHQHQQQHHDKHWVTQCNNHRGSRGITGGNEHMVRAGSLFPKEPRTRPYSIGWPFIKSDHSIGQVIMRASCSWLICRV